MPASAALRQFFTAGAQDGSDLPPWRLPAVRHMFWLGLALRLLVVTLGHTYRFKIIEDHFYFGWEMGRIARALNTGHGFADPFTGHTGPTAWTPPLYPILIAGLFRLFGIYTQASAWWLLAMNSVCSAATAPAVFAIARRCYGASPRGRSVALWSGWLWALYPAAMQYAVHWPWDMAVTAWIFSLALLLGLRLRGVGGPAEALRPRTWTFFGLAWGLVSLLNSSLLSFLPIQVLWVLWPFRRRPLQAVVPGLAALLVFSACLGPWILRNQRAFHTFVPLRTNLGVELYEAALPSHEGFPSGPDIPLATGDPELQRYARLGEVAYNRARGQEGKAIIAADPSRFLGYILLRFQFFWAGVPHPYGDHGALSEFLRQLSYSALSVTGLLGLLLSLRRHIPASGIFAAAFAVIPVIYYVITVQARFRHPLEPLITIFSVYLFQSADRSRLFSFTHPKLTMPAEVAP